MTRGSPEGEPLSPVSNGAAAQPFHGQAFGLRWASDHPLRRFLEAIEPAGPDVRVRRVGTLPPRPGGTIVGSGRVFNDGARFTFGATTFDVFDGERIDWCGPGAEIPDAFYGTVAAIVLAWRGLTPLHGSAVEFNGRAVLLTGPSGAGKSTLCDALVGRGGRLVSDDLSALLPPPGPGSPLLIPGRPDVRLLPDGGGAKALRRLPMTPTGRPVPLSTVVVLGGTDDVAGPAAACETMRRQLFRPRWMSALPSARSRIATLLHAAPRVAFVGLPSAIQRPDIPLTRKVDMILERLPVGETPHVPA